MLIGCGLVVLILIAFLYEWRTAVISLTAIPLSDRRRRLRCSIAWVGR